MVKLSPSVMCADFRCLEKEVQELERAGADLFHFDINDGHFVPSISMGPLVVASLREVSDVPFEIHLQTTDPEKYLDDLIGAGADVLIIHVESCLHFFRVVKKIKDAGLKAGVALNPITPLSCLEHIIPDMDTLLLMTVDAGLLGQPFIPRILEKIRSAKKMIESRKLNCEIEVDGCINKSTIPEVVKAGASILALGSSGLFSIEGKRESTMRDIRDMVDAL